jgi:membrane protein YdbS with pleckstrin-like domain
VTGNQEPRGLVSRLVMTSLGLLVAAVALTLAFDLLTRIWPWLALIAVLSGVVTVAIWITRRHRRW